MGAIPVYAPADTAIPAAEIPAPAHFDRTLGDHRVLLQRERKDGVPDWSVVAFGVGVAGCVIGLRIAAGLALMRIAGGRPERVEHPARPLLWKLGAWPKTPESGSSRRPVS
jgi:hypothetical protein